MNLMQGNYGHQHSVLAGQGRLFAERVCRYHLGGPGNNGKENLHDRITKLDAAVQPDLHQLRKYGNRADHDEMDDIQPKEKPDIVHCVFRVACRILQGAHLQADLSRMGAEKEQHVQAEQVKGEFQRLGFGTEVTPALLTSLTEFGVDTADELAELEVEDLVKCGMRPLKARQMWQAMHS